MRLFSLQSDHPSPSKIDGYPVRPYQQNWEIGHSKQEGVGFCVVVASWCFIGLSEVDLMTFASFIPLDWK